MENRVVIDNKNIFQRKKKENITKDLNQINKQPNEDNNDITFSTYFQPNATEINRSK